MSFTAVTHNEAQSTSPTHHSSESKTSSTVEKKHFSLGNLTGMFKPSWKGLRFSKTKESESDVDDGSSVPLQTRSIQQSDGRCKQKPQRHASRSSMDLLEYVDRIEEDITLSVKVSAYNSYISYN